MKIKVTTNSNRYSVSSTAVVGLGYVKSVPYGVRDWHEHSHLARQAVREAFPGRDVASQSCRQDAPSIYVHEVVLS